MHLSISILMLNSQVGQVEGLVHCSYQRCIAHGKMKHLQMLGPERLQSRLVELNFYHVKAVKLTTRKGVYHELHCDTRS